MGNSKKAVIVGGGIIGLAIGRALSNEFPELKVTILEKEKSLALHASGRNSGVMHAGFYYSPNSLKAKFCRLGNSELKKLCVKHSIPVLECGKVVVAQNAEEDNRLEWLFERGTQNGVDLELLDKSKLGNIEPLAKTLSRFIWSPTTAVSDQKAILEAMKMDFLDSGGKIEFTREADVYEQNGLIQVKGYSADVVINTAGAQADKLAHSVGVGLEYGMIPFMGVYRVTDGKSLPVRTLVYPVPHAINPFLGVHITRTIDGMSKIGPSAIPVVAREQYSAFTNINISDLRNTISGVRALAKGDKHSVREIIKKEFPLLLKSSLVSEASTLVPSVKQVKKWNRKPPGIRSQLVNLENGNLEQDFIVRTKSNSIHVLNAVSPGWTSAIPFGQWIVENYVRALIT